jgi:hypothetical protein
LVRALSVSTPYALLNPDEVNAFTKARRHSQTTDERYRGVTDLFRFSDVYFNRNGTLALSFVSTWCGNLCGLFKWKVFEKLADGTWEERKWVNCAGRSSTRQLPSLLISDCHSDIVSAVCDSMGPTQTAVCTMKSFDAGSTSMNWPSAPLSANMRRLPGRTQT